MLSTQIQEQIDLKHLYWQSFALRFGIGMAGWTIFLLSQWGYMPDFGLINDAKYYDKAAHWVATDWLAGRPSVWFHTQAGKQFQPYVLVTVLACFYVLTLGVRALPVILALYSALTAFVPIWTYRIAAELGTSHRTAMFGARIIAFLPAFVFWSSALYKEGLILLCINIAFYYALRFQRFPKPSYFLAVGFCLFVLYGLRVYLVPMLAIPLVFGIWFQRSQGLGSTAGPTANRTIAGLVLFGIIFAVIFQNVLSLENPIQETFYDWQGVGEAPPGSMIAQINLGIGQINASRMDLANAPSGYLKDVRFYNIRDLLVFLPKGMMYFLSVPLPWQIGSLRNNIGIVDSGMWLFLFYPLIVTGLTKLWKRDFPAVVMLIGGSLGMLILYSSFIGNIGSVYRMRIQIWLLWVPFVGIGWEYWMGRSPFALARRRRRRPPVAPSKVAVNGF